MVKEYTYLSGYVINKASVLGTIYMYMYANITLHNKYQDLLMQLACLGKL